jgi:hypothetical protein
MERLDSLIALSETTAYNLKRHEAGAFQPLDDQTLRLAVLPHSDNWKVIKHIGCEEFATLGS